MNNTATATATKIRPNKFAGRCSGCGVQVAARAGNLAGKVDGRWVTHCLACHASMGHLFSGSSSSAAPARRQVRDECPTGGDCWSFGHVAHCRSCGK